MVVIVLKTMTELLVAVVVPVKLVTKVLLAVAQTLLKVAMV